MSICAFFVVVQKRGELAGKTDHAADTKAAGWNPGNAVLQRVSFSSVSPGTLPSTGGFVQSYGPGLGELTSAGLSKLRTEDGECRFDLEE
jgi:hypothetical protein